MSPGIYGKGMESHGESDISTEAVGMGTGYKYFFGNCWNEITETILNGNGKKTLPEEGPG